MRFFWFLSCCALFMASISAETYFKDSFDDGKAWEKRWTQSSAKSDFGRIVLGTGKDTFHVDQDIEMGLMTDEDARFYAMTAKTKVFTNKAQDLVVQFSLKNFARDGGFCGGGYIKLLPDSFDAKKFNGESDYYIMFGPDICGYDVSRIHLIFNFEGENMLKTEDIKLEYDDKTDLTHLYTLVIRPDNTYTVYFDHQEKSHGFLHDGWDFPQKQIGDPSDKKPSDWVNEEMIDDPEDKKPDDWDDIPKMIPDPEATQPDDWDPEDDGEWEAPLISNPDYMGEWKPKKIKNPEYKGPWIQKMIDNPDFIEDVYFYNNIGGVGIDWWVVNSGFVFDNLYVGNSLEEAKEMAANTFDKVTSLEKEAKEKFKKEKEDKDKAKDVEEEEGEDLDEVKEEL